MTEQKYIFGISLASNNLPVLVIFNKHNIMMHKDVSSFLYMEPVEAGFTMNDKFYGYSYSLDVGTSPEVDEAIRYKKKLNYIKLLYVWDSVEEVITVYGDEETLLELKDHYSTRLVND